MPLKKNVHWLPVELQDKDSDITLTEEIERFAAYVGVSH